MDQSRGQINNSDVDNILTEVSLQIKEYGNKHFGEYPDYLEIERSKYYLLAQYADSVPSCIVSFFPRENHPVLRFSGIPLCII